MDPSSSSAGDNVSPASGCPLECARKRLHGFAVVAKLQRCIISAVMGFSEIGDEVQYFDGSKTTASVSSSGDVVECSWPPFLDFAQRSCRSGVANQRALKASTDAARMAEAKKIYDIDGFGLDLVILLISYCDFLMD